MPQTSEAAKMYDEGPTLVLTRPKARSEAFLALCESAAGHRLPAVISPVLEIVDCGDLPDLSDYGTVVITSGSAVERLGGGGVLQGQDVATVGEETARRARSFGASATCLGDNVDAFLASDADLKTPLIHCRGVHTRGDLSARMTALGKHCDEAIIYDQIARPLSPAARSVLGGKGPVVLPLFSPRSARLVAEAGPVSAPVIVVAMSDAVAAAWPGGGVVRIAEELTNQSMCKAVLSAF